MRIERCEFLKLTTAANLCPLTSPIEILRGGTLVQYNFCEILPASISGFVHVDLDEHCEFDPGKAPISGVTMHLVNGNGTVVATTQTNRNGQYFFKDLAPGNYSIVEEQPIEFFNNN